MKSIITIFICLSIFVTLPAWAEHPKHTHDDISAKETVATLEAAACENIINIKVNGLVCDFCARALEKVFGKRENVAGINVDLNNSNVRVVMKPGETINNNTLTQLIKDSGYNVTSIDRGC